MTNRFDYIAYDASAQIQQAAFKQQFQVLEDLARGLAPGRPQSLVLTKLEEAYMWVGKAIRDDQIARGVVVELQEQRAKE